MKNGNIKKQYRTIRGSIIDMDRLRIENSHIKALGNANQNARGDVLDPKGNVIITREEIVQNRYKKETSGVKHVSLKNSNADTFLTPQQAIDNLSNQTKASSNITSTNLQPKIDDTTGLLERKTTRKMTDKGE
jgi:hypothetical protein